MIIVRNKFKIKMLQPIRLVGRNNKIKEYISDDGENDD